MSSSARFRDLHAAGNILVLPNAWDVASARIAEDAGAKAIATSSAAVAWAHGYPDGEKLSKDVVLSLLAEIVRVVRIPVSVDSEAGFSEEPAEVAEFVATLTRTGAVGINLEDGQSPPDLLAAKIKAIKQRCARDGLDMFINARTDVYLHALVPAERALDETISRGALYRDAGADGLFVPLVTELAAMHAISGAINLPLNVLVRPTLPPVAELKQAGVRRVSAGSDSCRAALGAYRRAAIELLEEGRHATLYAEAEGCPNMNGLMKRA